MVSFQTTLQCKLMLTWKVDVLIPAPVLFLMRFHLGIELKSVSSFYISFAYLNLIFQDSAYFIFPCSQDVDHGLWELCILCASLPNQFMLFYFIRKSVTLCSLSLFEATQVPCFICSDMLSCLDHIPQCLAKYQLSTGKTRLS